MFLSLSYAEQCVTWKLFGKNGEGYDEILFLDPIKFNIKSFLLNDIRISHGIFCTLADALVMVTCALIHFKDPGVLTP